MVYLDCYWYLNQIPQNDAKTSIATEFFCTTGPNAPGSKDVLLAKSNGERLKSNLKFEYLLKVCNLLY